MVICHMTVLGGSDPPPTRLQADQSPDFFRNKNLLKFQQSSKEISILVDLKSS